MELRDCTWCGSAQSIEHGVCQVCLMRFTDVTEEEAVVVLLPEPAPDPPVEEAAPGSSALAE